MTRLSVRVRPGAPRARIRGWRADGTLQLDVVAPPAEGRANRAALELLAEALGVAVRNLSVARGRAARSKWVVIAGLEADEVKQRIERALAEAPGAGHGG